MVSVELKQQRITQILDELTQQRRERRAIDFHAVAKGHPELMPDLGIRLAALQAREPGSVVSDCTEVKSELVFLAGAFREMEGFECIDEGAQGYVYKAFHRPTQRDVAIKILLNGPAATREQRLRFRREVELVARLRHPNIVRVYDSGEAAGYDFIVMEFIQGVRIDDYVCIEQLTVREVVSLFGLVCDAVSFAHQHAILHRDLKPSNILVDAQGQPHVVDFGLAKDLSGFTDASAVSQTGQVVGTLPYLSPDQVRGEPSSVQTDVYSLGVILYELLAGEHPYPITEDRLQTLSNIVSREPASPRKAHNFRGDSEVRAAGINSDLERIVLKALCKEPARRYVSAAELADDLRRYLSGEAVLARSASRIYVLRKTVRKFRMAFACLVVCLLLLVGALAGVTAAWRQSDRVARTAMAALEMASLLKLGSVERDAGRLTDAAVLFDKVIEIGESIESDDVQVLRQLCNGHHRLSEMLLEQKKADQAEKHVQQTFELATRLVKIEPGNLEYTSLMGFAELTRGRLSFVREDYAAALDRFKAASAIRERLLASRPGDPSLTSNLVTSLGWEASCARKLGLPDDALTSYGRAYDISRTLFEESPDNLSQGIDMVRAESKMSIAHLAFKLPQHDLEAADWLEKARARLNAIKNREDAAQRLWTIEQLDYEIATNQKIVSRRLANDQP